VRTAKNSASTHGKSHGAGAGIEPARLSARDFESREKLNIYAGFRLFCSAKKVLLCNIFFIGKMFFAE
jgi:hypothetical protein